MGTERRNCHHFNLDSSCPSCSSLYETWNKRLEESQDETFKDAESSNYKRERILKGSKHNVSIFHKDIPSQVEKKNFEYYQAMERFYEKEVFESPVYRLIMCERVKAKKIAAIVRIVALNKNRIINRETVRFIIRRFEHKWGIRYWTNTQMGLPIKQVPPTPSFIIRRQNSQVSIRISSIQSS